MASVITIFVFASGIDSLSRPKEPEVEVIDEIKPPRLAFQSIGSKRYKTLTTSTQTWMGENLKYSLIKARSSDTTSLHSRLFKSAFHPQQSSGNYSHSEARQAANQIEGWHLPNDEEWRQLIFDLGGKEVSSDFGHRMGIGRFTVCGKSRELLLNKGLSIDSDRKIKPFGLSYKEYSFWSSSSISHGWTFRVEEPSSHELKQQCIIVTFSTHGGSDTLHKVRLVKD